MESDGTAMTAQTRKKTDVLSASFHPLALSVGTPKLETDAKLTGSVSLDSAAMVA